MEPVCSSDGASAAAVVADEHGVSRARRGDTDWLPRVGRHRWTVIGRDAKIYERPAELEAYMRARVQVFLLPGQARVADLVHLVEVNLAAICARSLEGAAVAGVEPTATPI